jgi:hypothetical protein
MEDPYTELAGCVIRLREEIIELTGAVHELVEMLKRVI